MRVTLGVRLRVMVLPALAWAASCGKSRPVGDDAPVALDTSVDTAEAGDAYA